MEALFGLLFVVLFIPASMLWWHGVKAAGRAAKTAVTERPTETMNWIKFATTVLRK